jgi:hypothetical protein
MVRFQRHHDQCCIFWRVPAEASTNHTRRMPLGIQHKPFATFFTPCLKESSLFHVPGRLKEMLRLSGGLRSHNPPELAGSPYRNMKSVCHHFFVIGLGALAQDQV